MSDKKQNRWHSRISVRTPYLRRRYGHLFYRPKHVACQGKTRVQSPTLLHKSLRCWDDSTKRELWLHPRSVAFRVMGESTEQHFDCYFAIELSVFCSLHFSHAARADMGARLLGASSGSVAAVPPETARGCSWETPSTEVTGRVAAIPPIEDWALAWLKNVYT